MQSFVSLGFNLILITPATYYNIFLYYNTDRVLFSLLPDYVIPYAVHLLAHDPELESHEDAPNLRNIKE